jgi:hypothetical protein
MNPHIAAQLEPLLEQLSGWSERMVQVVEEITHHPPSLDRHFTTRTGFVFVLEHAGIAISGRRLMLLGKQGEHPADYQIACCLLTNIQIGGAQVTLVERFSDVAERHTTLRVVS